MDALSKILIINILTAVQDVYDMVTSQTASDEEIGISEINRFNLTNLKLVTELQQLDIKYTKQESEQIVLILCRLASNYYLEQGLIDQKLFLKCIDYLDQILMSSTTNTNYSLETVMSLVTDCLELPVYPHTIKLLEFCVMAEVKQNLVDNQLSQSSSTWKKLELTLKTKLTDLGNQNDPEIFMHDLMIINSILKLSNCIENSFLEFHQKRHLNNPECFCSKFELVEDQLLVFEEFDFKNVTLCPFDQLDLVKQMIEAINKKKDVTLIDVVTLMDISFQFLVNSSSRNLPASLKVTLMSILLSPFINFYKKINYCQIMTRLPASIKQSYNQKDVTEKIKTMQGRSLDLLSGLSLKKLDPLFEKLNFDLFEFILSQIGEQALISKLCKCFLSSMIYNADDLKLYLELFQKSLGSKNIQLAESFVPFMKNIICLASKQAVVHKVKENDGWQIKINCR